MRTINKLVENACLLPRGLRARKELEEKIEKYHGLLIEAEGLLCDVRAGKVANKLAHMIIEEIT